MHTSNLEAKQSRESLFHHPDKFRVSTPSIDSLHQREEKNSTATNNIPQASLTARENRSQVHLLLVAGQLHHFHT